MPSAGLSQLAMLCSDDCDGVRWAHAAKGMSDRHRLALGWRQAWQQQSKLSMKMLTCQLSLFQQRGIQLAKVMNAIYGALGGDHTCSVCMILDAQVKMAEQS